MMKGGSSAVTWLSGFLPLRGTSQRFTTCVTSHRLRSLLRRCFATAAEDNLGKDNKDSIWTKYQEKLESRAKRFAVFSFSHPSSQGFQSVDEFIANKKEEMAKLEAEKKAAQQAIQAQKKAEERGAQNTEIFRQHKGEKKSPSAAKVHFFFFFSLFA
jgi:hypothetical protein